MFDVSLDRQPSTLEIAASRPRADILAPLRRWLDRREIRDEATARFLCRLIPPQCPFERDIYLFGHRIAKIPPLCHWNPLYEEIVALRFRALCYLADGCGYDIRSYC